jgi:DNA-binding response OmpR family regulator
VEQRTLDSGFDFYLSKPADLERLVAIVDVRAKSLVLSSRVAT